MVKETRVPRENHRPMTNFITYWCIEYTSPSTGFKLTTLVVIGTDCTGSGKSNYHTSMIDLSLFLAEITQAYEDDGHAANDFQQFKQF